MLYADGKSSEVMNSVEVTLFNSCLISLVGQWGEELPCVLWAAGRYERLGQTGALPARSRDLLLPKPSTSHISDQNYSPPLVFVLFSLPLHSLYMLHIYFSLSLSRVVPVNWRGSRTSRTSSFWFSALRPSVCMLTRSQLSGQSSPLSCSLATCASVHTRCVYIRDRVRIRQSRHWYHMSVGVFASERVVWGGSYLQRGWGQEGWLLVADFLWGPSDCHHSQSHSQ